jgi:hypothetical protein
VKGMGPGGSSDVKRVPRFVSHEMKKPCDFSARLSKYPQGDSNDPGKTREKRADAESTARQTAHFPADLQRVVEAWPTLDAETRRHVLALVDKARRPT